MSRHAKGFGLVRISRDEPQDDRSFASTRIRAVEVATPSRTTSPIIAALFVLGVLGGFFVSSAASATEKAPNAPPTPRETSPTEPRAAPPFLRKLGPTVGLQVEGYAERALGLRATYGRDVDGHNQLSATLFERGVAWLAADSISGRYEDELAIGHDERDIVYRTFLQGSIGYRPLVTKSFGPLVRVGIRASAEQEGGLRLFQLGFPIGEAGFQLRSPRYLFEAISYATPFQFGSVEMPGIGRELSGFSYGAAVGAVLRPVNFDLNVITLRSGDKDALYDGKSRICLLFGFGPLRPTHSTGDPRRPKVTGANSAEASNSLCAYGRLTSSPGVPRGPEDLSLSAGISFSFGAHSLLDASP